MKANFIRGAILLVLVGSLLAAQGPPLAMGAQSWIELRSRHFIVVSNASEHDARRVAEQFEMIRAVFREYFGNTSTNDQPVIIVAAKDEGSFRPLLPESWTKKGAAHRAGMFVNGPDRSFVGLRLDVSINQSALEPYEPIYHEYIHYLMRRMIPQLPRWMVEGLADFYGNTRIESKQVFVGAPSTSNLRILHEKTLLPVSTLFGVTASSPYYNEENKISIFYAESWALTHYLTTRDWQENTHRMTDFTVLLREKVPVADAARRTIGDAAVLDDRLNQYIQKFSFTAERLKRPKVEQGEFRIRSLTGAESMAVRADFVAHEGEYSKAQEMLEESIKLDPKLAAAYEDMGFLYFQQARIAEAEKWSAQALALDPQSDRANYYYAASVLRGYRLDDERVAKAEASLRAAIKSNSEFAPAFDSLAYCLSRPGSHQKLDEAYIMGSMAVSLDPSNTYYRTRLVDVLEKQGRAEDAIQVASLAVSLAMTPADHTIAETSLAGAKQFSKNPVLSPLAEDIRQKLHGKITNDKNAKTDLEHDVAALTKLLDAGSLDAADDAAARYFRASAQSLLNYFRKKDGLPPDTAVSEQSLSDLDRIIAGKSDIPAWGITIPEVAYSAGNIAWNGLHSSRTYSYWQLCADTVVPCMVDLALGYTSGWEGVQPDPAKALDLDLKAFDSGTRYRCAGAYAAHNIARLIYFAGVSYPKDNDPVSWTQKSYALSDPIEAQPNSENVCAGAETRMEEFLYRLAQGDRRNSLLTDAVQRFGDKATTAPALVKYFSGSLDANAFQSAVESSKSEFGRCYAYFHAMWYAYLIGDTSLVSKFYEPLSKFDQAPCRAYLVYARTFQCVGSGLLCAPSGKH